MSELKSKLPGKSKSAADLDDFLSGAEEKTAPKKEAVKRKYSYSWEDKGVRDDVKKTYNLRLSEPYLLKLKFIAENTPDSMQKFCIDLIEKEIDNKIKELTK
ncbi:hypothetical protein BJAS_P4242 [Bathymodiolus japonicus methanotrophic gill symbiont]|uniref:hypothetical protein n=1 Tax=Bathymodiolus japonicus methanotrophic gill symbiont TaxID=113269 RepID=UPI001B78B0EA|nr:hypothetical protein [Bathymodiolus japonicus methanotrophic gill symbiont]GFO72770.1 hypothetical protein BJAS_P3265 [Bathymodiolus japonicus methanotrophic gill symbiont]GFO73434.1 hypothetical protein BJAS_P4242 [Bathymodiolus japonicus methanotrophic gill symbiont]